MPYWLMPQSWLSAKLPRKREGVSMGDDTKANTIWGGGALELLEHIVPLDAARDDDDRGNAQLLA